MIAATRHDRFAEADYRRMLEIKMRTARDGARWHLIEKEPYRYDFSSLENQVRAANKTGIQIIWDLFHYGFPDDLDIFSAEFVERFARFAAATCRFLSEELNQPLFVCPINEISFFVWAAGEVGAIYPFAGGRGDELKRQMTRAAVSAVDAIRSMVPDTRFIQTDPAIHVAARQKKNQKAAETYRRSQFQAFDMLVETDEKYLDIIGLNYYFHNQWFFPSRRKIAPGHKNYRPFSEILREFYERYRRPVFIAETGIENEKRPEWFRYVCEEVKTARSNGVPIQGICLYPIVNHPGWDDGRHCRNGLWDYMDEKNERRIYLPLAEEIALQTQTFQANKKTF